MSSNVGGVAAFSGLATLTVTSSGLVIGIAVVGWNAAAASMVYSR